MAKMTALLGGMLILAGGVVAWQGSEMAGVRRQMAAQQAALAAEHERMAEMEQIWSAPVRTNRAQPASLQSGSAPEAPVVEASAARIDERRLILDQYQDVIAAMNLPDSTASRLKDLLADRIETVLDAQDAARREGFAEGTAQSAQAVAEAISGLDREISLLVGADGMRRLDGTAPSEPTVASVPATVVNVVFQAAPAAPAPTYAVGSEDGAAAYYTAYAAPYYYPPLAVFGYAHPRVARSTPGRTRLPGIHPREGFIHLH